MDRGYKKHDYIGLYSQKAIKAIGKINTIITAIKIGNEIDAHCEFGEQTDEKLKVIELAMKDAVNYGYEIRDKRHRYFFVEKFYETNFVKITPKAPMGARLFNLAELLSLDKLPSTDVIAAKLENLTWE